MKNLKPYKDHVNENIWAQITPWDAVKNAVTSAGQAIKDKLSGETKPLDSSVISPTASPVAKGQLIGQEMIEKNNPDCADAFKDKVIDICKRLGIANPNWLMLTIIKESECNPKARNPRGSASGLIQFLDKTAIALGTTIDKIRRMNGVEQLDYVYKYYKPYAGRMKCVEDVYLVTFMPGYFKDRNDNSKLMAFGSTAGDNAAIDLNRDGQIRMGEFKQYVTNRIPSKYHAAIA